MSKARNILVGYTGFVGSNLWSNGEFDAGFNSRNIEEAYGLEPDLLVYAGLRAEKFLANQFPEKDMMLIEEAKKNITLIKPKRIVLISTVDIYLNPCQIDEDAIIETDNLQPYGYNRYMLEEWVKEYDPEALIIRLPGLYGKGIKKNFIYDYINRIPSMLKEAKMEELCLKDSEIKEYYTLQDNGFYTCKKLSDDEKDVLRNKFNEVGFSALNFTDSRNHYQFYPLKRLWKDICCAMEAGIHLWNPATEPVSAAELYNYLCGEEFTNELAGTPVNYNYFTKYATVFGGESQYIMSKAEVLQDIAQFVKAEMK